MAKIVFTGEEGAKNWNDGRRVTVKKFVGKDGNIFTIEGKTGGILDADYVKNAKEIPLRVRGVPGDVTHGIYGVETIEADTIYSRKFVGKDGEVFFMHGNKDVYNSTYVEDAMKNKYKPAKEILERRAENGGKVKEERKSETTDKGKKKTAAKGKKPVQSKKIVFSKAKYSQAERAAVGASSRGRVSAENQKKIEQMRKNAKKKDSKFQQAVERNSDKSKQSWWQKAKGKVKSAVSGARKVVRKVTNAKPVKMARVLWNKPKAASKLITKSKIGQYAVRAAVGMTKLATIPVRVPYKISKGLVKGAYTVSKAVVKGSWKATKATWKAAEKAVDWAGKTKLAKYAKNNAVSKWLSKSVTKTAIKAFGKGTAKTILKKIPVVSAVVGTGLAIYEASRGNWGRATMELASGVAGCFPPVGTGISVAVDAAIIGYDIYENHQINKAREAAAAQALATTSLKDQEAKSQVRQQQMVREAEEAQRKADEAKKVAEAARARYEEQHRQFGNGGNSGNTGNEGGVGNGGGSGYTDNEGSSGNSGNSGQVGNQGYSGNSGNSGQSGNQGSSGYSGNSGQSGNQGNSGNSGNSGQSGNQGSSGNSGQSGNQGSSGNSGNETFSILGSRVESRGNAIVLTISNGMQFQITQAELEKSMSSKRAKGTMEKLQDLASIRPQPAGLSTVVATYIPEIKKEERGTATVNRNLVDQAVKVVGGSSKVTSITIDGKKIKTKDIQASFGCTKKEAKQILKAYGRAIEDGANLDNILRDVAQGKKITNESMRANPYMIKGGSRGY